MLQTSPSAECRVSPQQPGGGFHQRQESHCPVDLKIALNYNRTEPLMLTKKSWILTMKCSAARDVLHSCSSMQGTSVTLISVMCSWKVSDIKGGVNSSRLASWLKLQLPASSTREKRSIPSIKTLLIWMQTCTQEKLCTPAIKARYQDELLHLIICSDGLWETWSCRSAALKVSLWGHFQPDGDFWVAPSTFSYMHPSSKVRFH